MTHNEPSCAAIRQHLALAAGNDLEPEVQAAVESHLATCADCERQRQAVLAARERLAVLGRATREACASADLWPAISAGLRATPASVEPPKAETPRPRIAWRRVALPLLAAGALLFALPLALPALRPGSMGSDGAGTGTPPVASHAPSEAASNPPANPALAESAPEAGALRRAGPQDERLRDRALPLHLQLRTPFQPGGASGVDSLASDGDLR